MEVSYCWLIKKQYYNVLESYIDIKVYVCVLYFIIKCEGDFVSKYTINDPEMTTFILFNIQKNVHSFTEIMKASRL